MPSLAETDIAEVMETLRRFYNGYCFCNDLTQATVYNPTLCFYALRHYQKKAQLPDQMLDGNNPVTGLSAGIGNQRPTT